MKLSYLMRQIMLAGFLLTLAQPCTGQTDMQTRMLIDFSKPEEAGTWRVINDGVMGGLSTSEFVISEKTKAVFKGTVSLENNGGFASVRSLPDDYSLADSDGLLLELRGDGKRYKLRLRTDDRFDGYSYEVSFETRADEWMTTTIPLAEFRATFRGRAVPDAPPLDASAVRQIGFLIADKQVGSFRLEIAKIQAYTETDLGRRSSDATKAAEHDHQDH